MQTRYSVPVLPARADRLLPRVANQSSSFFFFESLLLLQELLSLFFKFLETLSMFCVALSRSSLSLTGKNGPAPGDQGGVLPDPGYFSSRADRYSPESPMFLQFSSFLVFESLLFFTLLLLQELLSLFLKFLETMISPFPVLPVV